MVCNPRQNLVQEKILEIVFSKEILFLIKVKKKYSDKISSFCQKENFFEKKFYWGKIFFGKKCFCREKFLSGKKFCWKKISLKENCFGKIFSLKKLCFCWEKNFFEKKFSDKGQKVQESDEIHQNLANKVTY